MSSANFDAEIKLNISPFLESIESAKKAVAELSGQIDNFNEKTLTINYSGPSGGMSGPDLGSGSKNRISAAQQQIAVEKQFGETQRENFRAASADYKEQQKNYDTLSKRMDDRINQESNLRSIESSRVKSSMQERAAESKNHATFSSQMDDRMFQEAKQRKDASNAIKGQMQDNASAANQAHRNLARERYALYDVAAAYTVVATAAGAVVTAFARTAIDYERSFSDIERTTENFFTSAKIGAAAEAAKNDLKLLAAEIPVAFGQITEIGTIGNQLGIAEGAIVTFTETVAKFAAATGMSVDAVAMSFGRIGELLNVPASEFEKLGSSIAFAGVNAVATEEQILTVTREISTTAKMAKFTTPEIIGLATAMSSLGIAAESARGSTIRTFARINQAVSEGGEKLDGYARISGMSAGAFASEWSENGQSAFDAFLAGLQKLSDEGESLDTVLRDIGFVNVRDIQNIQKLGDNYSVYASSIEDANKGFEEGAFLADAYGVIQDTVAAKLTLVSNNMSNVLDTLGQGAVGDVFKDILDSVSALLIGLNEFAKTPIGQAFGGTVLVLGVLLTVIGAINSASAIAQAAIRAFATAQIALIGPTEAASASVAKMNGQLVATGAAGNVASLGLSKGRIALKALLTTAKAVGFVVAIGLIISALDILAQRFTSVEQKAENLLGGFSGFQDALTDDIDEYNEKLKEFGGDVSKASVATGVIAGLSTEIENNNSQVNKTIIAQNALNNLVGLSANNASLLSERTQEMNFVLGANTRAWIANAIAQSDAFQKMSKNRAVMQSLAESGFNLNTALAAAVSGREDEYFRNLEINVNKNTNAFEAYYLSLTSLHSSSQESASSTNFLSSSIAKLRMFIIELIAPILTTIKGVANLVGIDLTPTITAFDNLKDSISGSAAQALIFGIRTERANKALADENASEYADQLEEIEDSAKGAAKALRTVVDFANDLRSIFARAFEIRFGQQNMLDNIASGWGSIAEKAEQATRAIADANAEIKELTADRSVLEYQLTVAERYGDEQRAAIIRAKIAKIDANVADKKKDISDATETLTKETDGNSKSAIENREVLQSQLTSYADLIEMYAKTGLRGKELRKRVNELKKEFKEQGIQAGYSTAQLRPFLKAFDDMRITINKTPRNVDVEFKSNISAAQQAINEYLAKLKQASGTFTTRVNLVLPSPGSLKMIIDPSDLKFYRMAASLPASHKGHLTSKEFYKAVYGLDLQSRAQGGYVSGAGGPTSDSIPAMLSNGEYVIRASSVSKFGQGFLESINQGKISKFGMGGKVKKYADGGAVASGTDFLNAINQQRSGSFTSSTSSVNNVSGSTVAHLSPEDRALLRAVIDRPVNLYTENAKIATSANAGNVVLAQRGTN